MSSVGVGLAVPQYKIALLTLRLMMVSKTKDPDDLIDWNDLCNIPP